MASVPSGVVTIRNIKHMEYMFSSDAELDEKRRHVITWMGGERPQPVEAFQWRIVKCGEAFRISNMLTKECMYANDPKYDPERRRVLTFDRAGAPPPQGDLAALWHIVPYGAAFAFKNAKHDEWLYADDPKLSEKCRHVLTKTPDNANPKDDPTRRWLVEAVGRDACTMDPMAELKLSAQHMPLLLQEGSGVQSCKVVRLESSGYDNGNMAAFYLDGTRLDFKPSRGLNLVTLDPVSLKVLSMRSYDIYDSYGERNQLTMDLNSLPDYCIVLAALKDSGMEKLGPAESHVLHGVGATFRKGEYREGYALIGVKGGCAVAEAQGQAVVAVGTVSGHASPAKEAVTVKLRHLNRFYRIKMKVPSLFADFESAISDATGATLSGVQPVHLDDEGDPCIINEATWLDFLESAGQKRTEKLILKVELRAVSSSPALQSSEHSHESESTSGSFAVLPNTS